MRNLIVVWVLCVIGLSIMSGCGISPAEYDCYDSFDEFDLSHLKISHPANEVISLSLVEGFEYKVNETFPLLVNNHSDKHIFLPKGYFQTIRRQLREDKYQNLTDCINRDLEFESYYLQEIWKKCRKSYFLISLLIIRRRLKTLKL